MHPVLFHLGHVVVPSFGMVAVVGLFAALRLSERTALLLGIHGTALWDASLFAVLTAFVTSRLVLLVSNLHAFRETPLLLLTVPSLTAGGLLFTALATLGYLRWRRVRLLRALDAWAAPGLVLWAALALGHLLESSDPGMPTEGWGLRSLAGYREQPVALYAMLLAFGLAGVTLDRTQARPRVGRLAAGALLGAGVAQFGLSFLRLPYFWESSTAWWTVLDPIEWTSLLMLVAGATVGLAGELAWDRPVHRPDADCPATLSARAATLLSREP